MEQSIIEKEAKDILYTFTESVNNISKKYILVASWTSPKPDVCILIITLYCKTNNEIAVNCQHTQTMYTNKIDRSSVEHAIKDFLFTFVMSPKGGETFTELYCSEQNNH